jgi:hypothetical protein
MTLSRLVPAGLLLLAGCSPTLDWREVRPEGSGAVALFPCKPDSRSREVNLAGAPVRLTLMACQAGDTTWALAHADVADPARVGPALAELRAAAVANLGAATTRESPSKIDGATPNAASLRLGFSGRAPDGRAMQEELALFAKGTRVFQATALGPKLAPDALEPFFTGLRLP